MEIPLQPPKVERDFTGGNILSLPKKAGSTGSEKIDRLVTELVNEWQCGENADYAHEMINTALLMGKDEIGEADFKLYNRALKEMRESTRVFGPYETIRKVSCYGSARTQPGEPEFQVAMEFADRMREHGFMTLTGAGDGIMGAAQKGAGAEHSFGLNINLPFEQSANETIQGDPKLINYNYFFTRKLAFVKESDACALFPGGFGTMDEGFEVLTLMQTGKATIYPVVMLDAPGGTYWKTWVQFVKDHLFRLKLISEEDFHLFKITDSVDEAIEEILHFYRVFHSYRFVRDKMVIRLNRKICPSSIPMLNEEFGDLLKEGEFWLSDALPQESGEETLAHLPRLVFKSNRGKAGRVRQLINAVNGCEPG